MESLRSKPKRVWIAALCAALALGGFGGWSYYSPWMAVASLESAANRGDTAELERLVDFEAVRQRLAADMALRAAGALKMAPESPAGLAAYAAFSSVTAALVTPQALTQAAREMTKAKAEGKGAAQKPSKPMELTGRYVNLGRFALVIAPRGSVAGSEAVVIQFRRLGPVSWRADRLVVPQLGAGVKPPPTPAG